MMIIRHGLSVGIERLDDEFLMTLMIAGKLTHDDYRIIVPLLEAATKDVKQPRVKALVNLLELDGWELRAIWDDFKFGLKHGREFSQVALVGNKKSEEYASKIGTWFIAGEMKFFDDEVHAEQWLTN